MRKIFSIIFLLPLACALSGAEPEFTGEADPAAVEALRTEARMLASVFRTPWSRTGVKLTAVFSPAVPANSAEVQKSGGGYVLMLCGVPGGGEYDFGFRRRVFSALLAAAAGAAPATGKDAARLPAWLAAALEHRLRAGKYEGRLLANNRRAPVLRALAEAEKIPAARGVLAADPGGFDPGARAWMEELARALFFLGGRKVASREFLNLCFAHAAPAKVPFPGENDKAFQDRFAVALRRFAWHTLSPRPARWAVKKFAEVRRVKLPVLDETGKPVPGKFEECDLVEIGDKLRDRPDAALHAGALKRRIFNFAAGDSRQVRTAVIALAELAGTADRPPFRYRAKLEQAVEKVLAGMRRRERIDACMAEAEFRYAPVRRAFRVRLESNGFYDRGDSLLSTEARKWLDRREREFM